MTCGIYKIRNKITDWKYVGSSRNIEDRWSGHIKLLNLGNHHCKHLQRAWKKYGKEGFEFSIEEVCSEDELLEREQSYLPPQKSYRALKQNKLYNSSPITTGTFPRKSNRKVEPKSPNTERHNENLKASSFVGRFGLPEETRKKIGAKNKGKEKSIEHKLRIADSIRSRENQEDLVRKMVHGSLVKRYEDKKKKKEEEEKIRIEQYAALLLKQEEERLERFRLARIQRALKGWLLVDTSTT